MIPIFEVVREDFFNKQGSTRLLEKILSIFDQIAPSEKIYKCLQETANMCQRLTPDKKYLDRTGSPIISPDGIRFFSSLVDFKQRLGKSMIIAKPDRDPELDPPPLT